MSPERWQRVEELFSAAQSRTDAERERWLAEQCQDDAGLSEEVRSLLRVAHADDDLLSRHGNAASPGMLALAGPATLVGGAVLGPYVISRLLGAGGMGEVYLAHDSRLHRPVALKLLAGWLQDSAALLQRFTDEALSLSALNHPNIPVVYETGEIAGRRFIASEFVDGAPLSERLRSGALPWQEAVEIAAKVGEALSAAHAAGIIHRDVKPANILLGSEGRVKLTDFGIAKAIEGRSQGEATQIGMVLGTPGYMSPEQALGMPADARSDLWSLTAVLHEMLTGQRIGPGPLPVVRIPGIPAAMRALLARGLQAAPAARFQSAAEFLAALRHSRESAVWPARRGPALVAAAVALAGAVALTLWFRPSAASLPGATAPSLLVLRFDTTGSDETARQFGEGIRDEVLGHLARISGLRVLAGKVATGLPTRPGDPGAVRAQFGVDALLEGSVAVSGEHLRLSLQLVDTLHGRGLWSDTFDRERREVFNVERDVAEQVAARLKARLLPGERTALETADTASPDAHAALLRGQLFLLRGDPEALRKAVGSFQDAIRLDPDYALAHALLAITWRNLRGDVAGPELLRAGAQARAEAERSVRLDPGLSQAHVALGWIFRDLDWDLQGAAHEFSEGERLAPNSAGAKNALATLEAVLGHFEQAGSLLEQARRLDPVSGSFAANLGRIRLAQGRDAEAEKLLREALDLEPAAQQDRSALALLLGARGALAEARLQAQREPEPAMRDFAQTVLLQWQGPRQRADEALRHFSTTYQSDSPFLVAQVHAYRGDAELAFKWLDRAYDSRDSGTIEFMLCPAFRGLHNDPRFRAFAAKLGIPATDG